MAKREWAGLWDLTSGELVGRLPAACHRLAFSRRGDLYTHGADGLMRWPVAIGDDGRVAVGPPSPLSDLKPSKAMAVAVSADGRIVAATFDAGVGVIDLDRPGRTVWLGSQVDVRNVSVSPDGRFVAAASWHGGEGVKVYEAATGRPVASMGESLETTAEFSPDGRWLAVSSDKPRRLWRVSDWTPGPVIGGAAQSFTGDGKLLACASPEGVIRLLRADTASEVARLEPADLERVYDLVFSPDGTRLTVSCGLDQLVYTWDLRSIRERLEELELDWDEPPLPEAGPAPPLSITVDEGPGAIGGLVREAIRSTVGRRLGRSTDEEIMESARSAIRRKAFDRALGRLDRAVEIRPDWAEAHYERGQILLRHRRDPRAAVEAFARAVAADPKWHEARLGLAAARVASGHAGEAKADLDALLAARPWDVAARTLRGRVLIDTGHRTRPSMT